MTNAELRARFVSLAPKEWNAYCNICDACAWTINDVRYTTEYGEESDAAFALLDYLGVDYDIGRGIEPGMSAHEWYVVLCDERRDNIKRWHHPEPVYAVLMAICDHFESTKEPK